ncbi:MAG: hypothetical protein VKJ02_17800 [Snowella sp.]|nr:hypothetical protein [Snowella sp.]
MKNQPILLICKKFFQKNQTKKASILPSGYTLLELLIFCSMLGIFAALVVNAKPWYENPLGNNRDQIVGILKLVRVRAMATTSTYRIRPDPVNPNQKLQVELTKSGSCQAIAQLTAEALATTTELSVTNTNDFAVGDAIQVGTDAQNNNIVSINPDILTLTLGQPLGTDQVENATVVMLKNWVNESLFFPEDLMLASDITMSGKNAATSQPIDWTICVNSRGFITLFDANTTVNANLELTLMNSRTNETQTITVYPGGAISVPE